MLTYIYISISIFLLINICLGILCIHHHFNLQTTQRVFSILYGRFFYKLRILLTACFSHPLYTIKHIVSKILTFYFSIFQAVLRPWAFISFCLYPFIIYIIFTSSKIFVSSFIFRAIITIIGFIIFFISFGFYCKKVETVLAKIWYYHCYLYQLFKNVSNDSWSHILNNKSFTYADPKEYATKKVTDYIESMNKVPSEKNEDTKNKERALTYLDMCFEQELKIFDLYKKDFTIDDLKHKKRDLLKENHPDNFSNQNDIELHKEKCIKINNAYTLLLNELKKEA